MARKSEELVEEARPQTLDEATGGASTAALAIRDNANDEREVNVSFGHFTASPVLRPKDMIMPQLRLAQGLSQEVQDDLAKVGQWLLPGEEPHDNYTFIPLGYQAGRELRDLDQNGKIVCRSDNQIVGRGDPGGACEDCPFAKWTPYEDPKSGETRNKAPLCNETYKYIGYVVEADSLAILSFKRTSLQVGKQMNSFAHKGLGNYAVTLGSTKIKGPKGTYALPTVSLAKVDADDLAYAQSLLGTHLSAAA